MTEQSSTGGEVVPPSTEPDAAVGTGSGAPREGAPPPDPEQAASTSGLGTQDQQHGEPDDGPAPYSLDGDDNPTEQRSPSGT